MSVPFEVSLDDLTSLVRVNPFVSKSGVDRWDFMVLSSNSKRKPQDTMGAQTRMDFDAQRQGALILDLIFATAL